MITTPPKEIAVHTVALPVPINHQVKLCTALEREHGKGLVMRQNPEGTKLWFIKPEGGSK